MRAGPRGWPWYERPLTWVVVLLVVVPVVGPGVAAFVALALVVLASVAKVRRWGSRGMPTTATVCGVVVLAGAVYVDRVPDGHNGIGDLGAILLAALFLAVLTWACEVERRTDARPARG